MSRVFLRIMQRFLCHIVFGANIDHLEVKIRSRKNSKDPYTESIMSLSDAIETTFLQIFETGPAKLGNPIWKTLYSLTGKSYAMTPFVKMVDQNSANIRTCIRDYVQKRISGELASDVKGKNDLLSLMLASPEIFTLEDCVDELMDFLAAGT